MGFFNGLLRDRALQLLLTKGTFLPQLSWKKTVHTLNVAVGKVFTPNEAQVYVWESAWTLPNFRGPK